MVWTEWPQFPLYPVLCTLHHNGPLTPKNGHVYQVHLTIVGSAGVATYINTDHIVSFINSKTFIIQYIILNNGISKLSSSVLPSSEGYISQYTH